MLDFAELDFPDFVPARWLAGPHAQTLASALAAGGATCSPPTPRAVVLPDGDAVVLHEETPERWRPGTPAVLLVHGLGGSHASGYLQRLAARLSAAGAAAYRLDLRGAGAAAALARRHYHLGRWDDVRRATEAIAQMRPAAPIVLVGFSLGGALVLGAAGGLGGPPPERLAGVVAVCPPLRPQQCVRGLERAPGRWYSRRLTRAVWREIAKRRLADPDMEFPAGAETPRTIRQLDEVFTAPLGGFASADDYYERCDAASALARMSVPTLIIASRDDPLAPLAAWEDAERSPSVHVHATQRGGHVGFLARRGVDPDRRWLDWRILQAVRAVAATHDQACRY